MADNGNMEQEGPFKGVLIRKLSRNEDERGWLTEIYRQDQNKARPVMSYISFTTFNAVRGPHEHTKQSDFFVFPGPGDFEVHLWDNRKDSPAFGKHEKLVLGESNRATLLVPPGVVHGYKSITEPGSFSMNLPDKMYKGEGKKEEVDEIRHENDPDSKFKIE